MDSARRAIVLVVIAAAGLAVLMPGSAGAGKNRVGKITVGKRVTLTMPSPGVYTGTVNARKASVGRDAVASDEPASNTEVRRAKRKALKLCRKQAAAAPVYVHHEPDDAPRETLGSNAPGADRTYTVTGPAVPSEDLVVAFQEPDTKRLRTGRFRWNAICERGGANELAP